MSTDEDLQKIVNQDRLEWERSRVEGAWEPE